MPVQKSLSACWWLQQRGVDCPVVSRCWQKMRTVVVLQGFTTFSATALALTFVFGDSVKGVFEVRTLGVQSIKLCSC